MEEKLNYETKNWTREEQEKIYEKAKGNSVGNQQKISKQKLRKKSIKTMLLTLIIVCLSNLAITGYQQFIGSEMIANKLYQEAVLKSGYNLRDGSNGFTADNGSSIVPLGEATGQIIYEARNSGMNDTEIYIALTTLYNSTLAENCLGDKPTRQEIKDANREAFLEKELSNIQERKGR